MVTGGAMGIGRSVYSLLAREAATVALTGESWIFVAIAATLGLLASLALNLGASVELTLHASSPAFQHEFDQRYLIVSTIAWRCRRGASFS